MFYLNEAQRLQLCNGDLEYKAAPLKFHKLGTPKSSDFPTPPVLELEMRCYNEERYLSMFLPQPKTKYLLFFPFQFSLCSSPFRPGPHSGEDPKGPKPSPY